MCIRDPSVTKTGILSERCLLTNSTNLSAAYCFLGPITKSSISLQPGTQATHINGPVSSSSFMLGTIFFRLSHTVRTFLSLTLPRASSYCHLLYGIVQLHELTVVSHWPIVPRKHRQWLQ